MRRKCIVTIQKGDQNIQKGMEVYPTAWADVIMDTKGSRSEDSKVYEIDGELIEVSGNRGCISLKNGLLLSVPLCCIRLTDM